MTHRLAEYSIENLVIFFLNKLINKFSEKINRRYWKSRGFCGVLENNFALIGLGLDPIRRFRRASIFERKFAERAPRNRMQNTGRCSVFAFRFSDARSTVPISDRVRRRNEDRTRYRLPRGNNTGCGVRQTCAASCNVEPAATSRERSISETERS